MSRYHTSREGQTIAYGFDHACGYFYQVFDAEDELIREEDSFFNNLTGPRLAETLCGGEDPLIAVLSNTADPPPGVARAHLDAMMLDLSF